MIVINYMLILATYTYLATPINSPPENFNHNNHSNNGSVQDDHNKMALNTSYGWTYLNSASNMCDISQHSNSYNTEIPNVGHNPKPSNICGSHYLNSQSFFQSSNPSENQNRDQN